MLQDRPYMRDGYDRPRTSVLTWLLCSIVAVYLVQSVLVHLFPGTAYWFESALGLSAYSLRSGYVWTLVTYGFLHDTGNLLQILGYLLVIYFVGREVLPILGARRFAGSTPRRSRPGAWSRRRSTGGTPRCSTARRRPSGRSIILYACFFPNREVTLLVFFVLPVTFKPKHLAYLLIGLDLFGFVFYELLGSASPFGVAAHSAHLGGMAAGWIYFRYLHDTNWGSDQAHADIELPRWLKQRGKAKAAAPAPAFSVNIGGKGPHPGRGGPDPRQDQQRRLRVPFGGGEEDPGRGPGPDRQALGPHPSAPRAQPMVPRLAHAYLGRPRA
jgi:membrane associated rhomboid family serine protease